MRVEPDTAKGMVDDQSIAYPGAMPVGKAAKKPSRKAKRSAGAAKKPARAKTKAKSVPKKKPVAAKAKAKPKKPKKPKKVAKAKISKKAIVVPKPRRAMATPPVTR